MERQDEVQAVFKYSEILGKISYILFWINVVLTAISMVWKGFLSEYLVEGQILIVIAYIIITTVDDVHFWYKAESSRRKNALEDALEMDVTGLHTSGYYNNSFEPSLERYIVNIFESCFFSKNIAKKMGFSEIIKLVVAAVVFIVALREVHSGEIILFISQIVFSAEVTSNAIALMCYVRRMDDLYEKLYRELVTVGIDGIMPFRVALIDIFEYESIKAHYKVRLSSKIYHQMNESLSEEWSEIERNIKFNNIG